MIRKTARFFPGKGIQFLLFFIALAVIAGCTGINRLHEAQNAFNQAAALENTIQLETSQDASGAVKALSIRSGYTDALMSLEKIESKDIQKLKQDGLLGSLLTLKALAQWRLGLYDKALATAAEAKKAEDQLYPRDRCLLEALPGLIKIDQAYQKIEKGGSKLEEVKFLLTGDRGAVKDLDSARGLVNKDHSVQIYLIQSQLSAYRNLYIAYIRLNNGKPIEEDNPARKDAEKQLMDLKSLLAQNMDKEAANRLINDWNQKLHIKVENIK
jgi:hypothetical protein